MSKPIWTTLIVLACAAFIFWIEPPVPESPSQVRWVLYGFPVLAWIIAGSLSDWFWRRVIRFHYLREGYNLESAEQMVASYVTGARESSNLRWLRKDPFKRLRRLRNL